MLQALYHQIDLLSSINNYEYIEIISTVETMHEENFNCSKCLSTYSKRVDYEKNKANYDKSLDLLRSKKGCEKPGPSKYKIENIKFNLCVGNFYSQSASMFIDLYYNYQRGVMPYDGSLMDQPSKIIEVFNIIDGLIKAKESEMVKKYQKDMDSKTQRMSNGKRSKI